MSAAWALVWSVASDYTMTRTFLSMELRAFFPELRERY